MGDHDNHRTEDPDPKSCSLSPSLLTLPAKTRDMTDILEQYSSLSSSSGPSDIKVVLGNIINGNHATFIPISLLILTSTHSWSGGPRQWNPDISHRAFVEGYQHLCAESQIRQIEDLYQMSRFRRSVLVATLHLTQQTDVAQAVLALKILCRNPAGSDLITRPSTLSALISAAEAFKDTPNATSEVLRCIANGLLLIPDSRSMFVTREVGGGPAVLGMLEVGIEPVDVIFILLNPTIRGHLRPTSYL